MNEQRRLASRTLFPGMGSSGQAVEAQFSISSSMTPEPEPLALFDASSLHRLDTWTRHVHPDGTPYFHHPSSRVVTDLSISDSAKLKGLIEEVDTAVSFLSNSAYFGKHGGDYTWAICYEHGSCFFIDHVGQVTVSYGDDPSTWSHDTFLQRRANFWGTLSRYPMHHALPTDGVAEFVGALAHGFSDMAVHNDYPVFVYPKRKCEAIMRAYDFLKDSPAEASGSMTCLVSRTMHDVYHHRRKLYYGTPYAILSYRPRQLEPSSRVLSVLLLGTHANYLQRLRKAEVGRVGDHVYAEDMRSLMVELLNDWRETRLLAAIMCCCYIAFLAFIPDVGYLTRSLIALGILLALASVVTSLSHSYRHKAKLSGTFDDAYRFRHQLEGLSNGDLALSALLALPVGLLLWSLVVFGLAVAVTVAVPN